MSLKLSRQFTEGRKFDKHSLKHLVPHMYSCREDDIVLRNVLWIASTDSALTTGIHFFSNMQQSCVYETKFGPHVWGILNDF